MWFYLGAFRMKRKRTLQSRIDSYSNFYKRTFSDVDIEKILEEGGQSSLANFKQVSKTNTKSMDYWNAMFEKRGNLGKEIFKRYVENGNVAQNRIGKLIVRTGSKFDFGGKTYKGGQFIPRTYFTRRTNK